MEECIPVYMVIAVISPLLATITILWRRIGQLDARTESMLDSLWEQTQRATGKGDE